MNFRLIFYFLATVSIAAAQPIDARNDLIFPTNPPRWALPAPARESTPRIAPVTPLVSTSPSSEAFLRAYKQFQEGERMKSMQKTNEAIYCFAEALSELIALQKSDKEFEAKSVQYRINKTVKQLNELILIE